MNTLSQTKVSFYNIKRTIQTKIEHKKIIIRQRHTGIQMTCLNAASSFATEHCSIGIYCETFVYIQIHTKAQPKPLDKLVQKCQLLLKHSRSLSNKIITSLSASNTNTTAFHFSSCIFKGVSQPISNTKLSILLLTLRKTQPPCPRTDCQQSAGLDTKMRWCLELKFLLCRYLVNC